MSPRRFRPLGGGPPFWGLVVRISPFFPFETRGNLGRAFAFFFPKGVLAPGRDGTRGGGKIVSGSMGGGGWAVPRAPMGAVGKGNFRDPPPPLLGVRPDRGGYGGRDRGELLGPGVGAGVSQKPQKKGPPF